MKPMILRYRALDFIHHSETETLLLHPPYLRHACGQADLILPGGSARLGWIRGRLWEEGGAI